MPHRTARKKMASLLQRQPRWLLLIECILLVLIIGYIDYITGYEISLFIFYAVPILVAVWFLDKESAVLIAVLSALVWWWADIKAGHPYLTNWVEIYNTFV